MPRDSGETIFAARHQSVSQGPLGVFSVSRGPLRSFAIRAIRAIFWPKKGVKGLFRTKNTTVIAKIVNYYAVVFFTTPPLIHYTADPSWRGKSL